MKFLNNILSLGILIVVISLTTSVASPGINKLVNFRVIGEEADTIPDVRAAWFLQPAGISIKPCFCPVTTQARCGIDGIFYRNLCLLRCAFFAMGEDPEPIPCYSDEVMVKSEDVRECILCPYLLDPQCGVDGVTYPNECVLKCADVELDHLGYCDSDSIAFRNGDSEGVQGGNGFCDCGWENNPVCGEDGVTYPNECQAKCANVPIADNGECEFIRLRPA